MSDTPVASSAQAAVEALRALATDISTQVDALMADVKAQLDAHVAAVHAKVDEIQATLAAE